MNLVSSRSSAITGTTVLRSQPLVTVVSPLTSAWKGPSLHAISWIAPNTTTKTLDSPFFQPHRTMVTRKKRLAKRAKRRVLESAAAKKREEKVGFCVVCGVSQG